MSVVATNSKAVKLRGEISGFSRLESAGQHAVESLALLCPEWGAARLIFDMTTLEVAYANIAALRVLARQYPLSIHCGILGFAFGGGSEGLERRLLDLAVDERGEASIVLDEPRRGTTVGLRIWSPSGFVRSTLIRKVSNGATLGVMELVGLESGLSVARLRSFGLAFGLTSAELSVLALLGADLSLSEIAEARAVSTETVRNQCSGLLQKTRCRRLSELVRLVLTFCMGTNTF